MFESASLSSHPLKTRFIDDVLRDFLSKLAEHQSLGHNYGMSLLFGQNIIQEFESGSVKRLAQVAMNEFGANLLALNLYPFGVLRGRERRADPHPKHSPNTRPILLVHGVVHNPSAFIPLKKNLLNHGFKNIFSVNYRTRHGSLLKMVEDVERRSSEVMEITGAKQIDIIAHSLGGIVARYYMANGQGRGKVKKLVTMGTPHQGTAASSLLRGITSGSLFSDLRTESSLVKSLFETSLPRNSKLISISSKFDHMVWPQSNGRARGFPADAITNICVDTTGHMGLLYSREVLGHVMNSLKDA